MAVEARKPQSRAWLADLTALEARERLRRGEIKAVDLVEACLERVAEREGEVQAFAHLDPALVRAEAAALDRHRASGRPLGPLHGIPVGVKDIIDTRGMPTENGTALDAGRRPAQDAAIVARLRQAGAVIFGKTVTTELAVFTPGKTRNPHDPGRTPGGSSSGSAAAVAARMLPLALGTQTNGSVIRPASFCGVFGFKPSRGLVPRAGVLTQSPTLDTVGVFARSLEDAALLADEIAGYDPGDPSSELAARPDLLATATSQPPVRPALAFVRTPVWDQADADVHAGFDEIRQALGTDVEEVELPGAFAHAHDLHRIVHLADIARHYQNYVERGREAVSERLLAMYDEGRRVLATDYLRALDAIAVLSAGLEPIFNRYDAIVTPAAPGEAPADGTTGSPVFSTIWTFCGTPAVTLPLLVGANGLPIGVQVVGRRGHDGRLLRTARWLQTELSGGAAQ